MTKFKNFELYLENNEVTINAELVTFVRPYDTENDQKACIVRFGSGDQNSVVVKGDRAFVVGKLAG